MQKLNTVVSSLVVLSPRLFTIILHLFVHLRASIPKGSWSLTAVHTSQLRTPPRRWPFSAARSGGREVGGAAGRKEDGGASQM